MSSKTLMVWPTLHFPIFLADWDQGTIKFDVFCKSKKSIKFSLRLITFYYFKDLKNFNHGQYGLIHIVLSKKKRSNCVWTTLYFSKFLPETIRFKSYSPLNYFKQVSTKSFILFCIFKSCIFFSIYIILNKFESGTIRVDPYCPF